MIDEENPEEVDSEEMVERKLELCSTLAKYTSAVLLPIFGIAQCISHSILPNNTGLLVSIEACRLGVAMGTAAVLTPGTELCHRADVEELLPQIKVWKITN